MNLEENNENKKLKMDIVNPIRNVFTPEEDFQLQIFVKIYGLKNWKKIAELMKTRTARQCRERFKNYLSPQIQNGPWTQHEDNILLEKVSQYGKKWSIISNFFKNRSHVNIKNRFASLLINKRNKIIDKSNLNFQFPERNPEIDEFLLFQNSIDSFW